jgi:hypothetical protein
MVCNISPETLGLPSRTEVIPRNTELEPREVPRNIGPEVSGLPPRTAVIPRNTELEPWEVLHNIGPETLATRDIPRTLVTLHNIGLDVPAIMFKNNSLSIKAKCKEAVRENGLFAFIASNFYFDAEHQLMELLVIRLNGFLILPV